MGRAENTAPERTKEKMEKGLKVALPKDNSQYLTELQLLSCSQIGNRYREDPRKSP